MCTCWKFDVLMIIFIVAIKLFYLVASFNHHDLYDATQHWRTFIYHWHHKNMRNMQWHFRVITSNICIWMLYNSYNATNTNRFCSLPLQVHTFDIFGTKVANLFVRFKISLMKQSKYWLQLLLFSSLFLFRDFKTFISKSGDCVDKQHISFKKKRKKKKVQRGHACAF